uniref:Uncharacterized protein n=1 Tax=Arundo donax TaxID=35708 RepID=A0A0A9GQB2_ARUDO
MPKNYLQKQQTCPFLSKGNRILKLTSWLVQDNMELVAHQNWKQGASLWSRYIY